MLVFSSAVKPRTSNAICEENRNHKRTAFLFILKSFKSLLAIHLDLHQSSSVLHHRPCYPQPWHPGRSKRIALDRVPKGDPLKNKTLHMFVVFFLYKTIRNVRNETIRIQCRVLALINIKIPGHKSTPETPTPTIPRHVFKMGIISILIFSNHFILGTKHPGWYLNTQ